MTLDNLPPAFAHGDGEWLVLQAGDRVTRYRRVGRGNPILIAARPGTSRELLALITDRLVTRHRLIFPEILGGVDTFAPWLRDFADGVGLVPLSLLATGDLALPAFEFALAEPDRIGHLALTTCDMPDKRQVAGYLSATRYLPRIAPFLLHGDVPLPETLAALADYFGVPRPGV